MSEVEDREFVEIEARESAKGAEARGGYRPRKGAAGKALIAYLATGSIGTAIVVFIIAKVAGC